MENKRFLAMKPVYCYFFPEVRELLRAVQSALPDEFFLVTGDARKIEKVFERIFPTLEIPFNSFGGVDLDELHVPIINRIINAYSSIVPSLRDFSFAYPTSGSSEGIFHLLVNLKVNGVSEINLLEGEYEGFDIIARNIGLKVNHYNADELRPNEIPSSVWFISNPSSMNGNILPNKFINQLCNAGHKIVLDLTYAGLTKPFEFDVSHENIINVIMSFSKPYGVFRFRIGGFVFSRKEIPTLFGNKWFKDIIRIMQALKIVEEIKPGTLFFKYAATQQTILRKINNDFGLGIMASDALLLGYLPKEKAIGLNSAQQNIVKQFNRGSNYRFCLTPYFEEFEKKSESEKKCQGLIRG